MATDTTSADFGDPRFGGNAWQSYFTARVRPLGAGSFLTLGYGVTVARVSVHDRLLDQRAAVTDATDVRLIGLELPVWQVRPFAELYLVDLLERTASVGGNLLLGVSYRFR